MASVDFNFGGSLPLTQGGKHCDLKSYPRVRVWAWGGGVRNVGLMIRVRTIVGGYYSYAVRDRHVVTVRH